MESGSRSGVASTHSIMPSPVLVKISNIPCGIDEKDLAQVLLDGMTRLKIPASETFVSCEIRHKESVALLEFECRTATNSWTFLERIKINGEALKFLSYEVIKKKKEEHSSTEDVDDVSPSALVCQALIANGLPAPVENKDADLLDLIPQTPAPTSSNGSEVHVIANGLHPAPIENIEEENQHLTSAPTSIIGSEVHVNGGVKIPLMCDTKADEGSNVGVPPGSSAVASITLQSSVLQKIVSQAQGPPSISNGGKQNMQRALVKTTLPLLEPKQRAPKRKRQPAVKQEKVPNPHQNAVVFFDLETTGLDRGTCEIVQIAAAYDHYQYNVFIKPERGIPAEASAINGLTVVGDKLLKNGIVQKITEPKEAWIGFIKFLKNFGTAFLVGHNADWFDFPLLARDISKHGLTKDIKTVVKGCVDSLLMFRSRLPRRRGSFKQAVLAQEYGISTTNAHDALGDVRMLRSLCQKIGIPPHEIVKYKKPITKYF